MAAKKSADAASPAENPAEEPEITTAPETVADVEPVTEPAPPKRKKPDWLLRLTDEQREIVSNARAFVVDPNRSDPYRNLYTLIARMADELDTHEEQLKN